MDVPSREVTYGEALKGCKLLIVAIGLASFGIGEFFALRDRVAMPFLFATTLAGCGHCALKTRRPTPLPDDPLTKLTGRDS